MFTARRMLVKEFKSEEAFAAKDAQGRPRLFCVEHENGRIIPGLSWAEAVAEAKQLNEECATMLLA